MTYSVAQLRPSEDREALLALWMEVMASRSTLSTADWRYSWFFEQNPFGAPTTCVTHHVESQTVVASGSAHPRPTQVGGETRAAAVMSDFAVAKAHRTAAAALAVQRRLMGDSLERFDFIYGTPNSEAAPIFKRLAFHHIAKTASYSRILRTSSRLETMLKSRPLGRVAGAFLDRALAATDLRARVRHPRTFTSEILDRADDRFDDLWRRARGHYGITGERTASYLNWRYADFRTRAHRFFTMSERGSGRVVGYVAYSIENDVVFVDDLFCDAPKKTFASLLMRFTSAMRNGTNRSIWLSLVAEPSYERALKRMLFIKRPDQKSLIVQVRPDLPSSVASELLDGNRWFMVGGELDT